jgi:hypothetical protein
MNAAGCPSTHVITSFNVAATSGLYSTAAGVMAGFAFAALFFVITDEHSGDDDAQGRHDVAAQALASGFLALLLSAVCWAVVAGETITGGRASTIEVFAGCGFALAAVQLFYSLQLLIQARNRPNGQLRRFFQLAGGAFLAPAAFGLALLGVTDYGQTTSGNAGTIVLVAGIALWVALAAVVLYVVRDGAAVRQRNWARQLPFWANPSWATVAIGALALVLTSAFDGLANQCNTGSPYLVIAALAVTAAALANSALRFFHPPRKLSEGSPSG